MLAAPFDAAFKNGAESNRQTVLDFRKVWGLQGREFTRGILNEAKHHGDQEALQSLISLRSHLGKAMWAIFERPNLIRNAKILRDIDKLPNGAWLKYRDLPLRHGPVNSELEQSLQEALVVFFVETQLRGANCKVDCLLRDDESIFYAYSEDHPDTDLSFQTGVLTTQVVSPVFELIFKHNNTKRTLEIFIDDDRGIGPKLRSVFAHVVLGEEVDENEIDNARLYEPGRVLVPGFRFRHSSDLEIANVRVTKVRCVVQGEPWRRFTAEADDIENSHALEDFAVQLTEKLPQERLFVDQACINVLFQRRDDERKATNRQVWITYPNSLRLKRDELGDRIVEMLIQSEIERPESEGEP